MAADSRGGRTREWVAGGRPIAKNWELCEDTAISIASGCGCGGDPIGAGAGGIGGQRHFGHGRAENPPGRIAGEQRAEWLAGKATSSLRNKREQLRLVLRGEVTERHRYLLAELMDDVGRLEDKIQRPEAAIKVRMKPHEPVIECLITIPGVDVVTAWT